MLAMTNIDASELGSRSTISLPSAAAEMPVVVLATVMGNVDVTIAGVAIIRAVIVGATMITDSPLQSAAAIALLVWALIAADAPAIVADKAVAALMWATFTLKSVFTETVPGSWRKVASRRARRVKSVMVMSGAGTDRAVTNPFFLAVW